MNREELLAAVRPLRARELMGAPTSEELARYPAREEEFYIPAKDGHPIHIYRYAPLDLPRQMPTFTMPATARTGRAVILMRPRSMRICPC